ncbi:NUDIX domain-containing protein [Nocardiopsis sp. HUAS JQ3]|uniref:NUDIX domain-containing protein n=1 Tax=Nocardiopsis sp. HUAS JQ3 TaxID=3061629 RepID=UPI0023A991E0|nr:NUDIX domain-containing protein [Nocardiopsis sp. HUAS JQ3]WDZ94068.1 NUDIX domain-containing protein [Nocardiopsis sp. HUAS JQ3]
MWVTDPGFSHVLLVRHRWRGWVPPGGKVETGETPREAASRELLEETGVSGRLLPLPAAACVRSYRSDWSPTLGLSYVAIIDRSLRLGGEAGQPSAWIPLEDDWQSVFPEDCDRIRRHVRQLSRAHAVSAR